MSEIYPGWPGDATYVNIDVGLVDIADVNQWTSRLQNGEVMGPLVDISSVDFPLSLIGRRVKGYGAASGWMHAEVAALFYRYKSRGGFEYVADFLLASQVPTKEEKSLPKFSTQPGDSGTLWLLEPSRDSDTIDGAAHEQLARPLAIQWGADRLYAGSNGKADAYALATCLSTACEQLNVDVIRDWNLDQPNTWGAVGHFAIASRVARAISSKSPKLAQLMENNRAIISHDDDTILNSEFKHMGDDAFVPMADVPDFFWKHGKQGFTRGMEGPNHFADMDHRRDRDGKDLLQLCKDDQGNIDPTIWNDFYDELEELLTGDKIIQKYRGLLPFRVWQIYDSMVQFVKANKKTEFVCAAGILAHYIGDACQPLHISYLHDGDPLQASTHTVHHRDGTTDDKNVALGAGVHSAYEDAMVNANRQKILDGLDQTAQVDPADLIHSGREAAERTVALMQNTFSLLPPAKIVAAYIELSDDKKTVPAQFWKKFGKKTITAMQDGTNLLAVLWESAWTAGGGEEKIRDASAIDENDAMEVCKQKDFLPSYSIAEIAVVLKR